MLFKFAGKISLKEAVSLQQPGLVLGFECEPTVSLGVRGAEEDLLWAEHEWKARGFTIHRVDRGGQATIHNPGQLVIFPCLDVRLWGARRFVEHLTSASQRFLEREGLLTQSRALEPGLYSSKGKVMSLGLRIRQGIAHHGIAINVHNELADFAGIRVCGKAAADMDRLITTKPLPELFSLWVEEFKAQLTRPPNSPNLGAETVRMCALSSVG